MDFSRVELTPENKNFVEEARAFLGQHWTPDPTAIAVDHDRVPAEFRLALSERGWIRPRAPKSEGGAELDAVEAQLLSNLLNELGIPGTGGSELLIPAITRYGSELVKREVLPRIRSGEVTVCLGYTEPDNGSDMAAARTRAVKDGDEWVINGQKMFTTWGNESDYVFLLTRTGAVEERQRTLTMFLVPMDTPGVEVGPVWIIGGGRTNVTYYSDVRISDDYRLGPVNSGWAVVSEPLSIEHGIDKAAEGIEPINGSMGTMFSHTFEKLIGFAIDWAASRRMPDGRSKLHDPLVRAALAEAILDLEVCWNCPGEMGKPIAGEALIHWADAFADMAAPEGILDRGVDGQVAAGVIAGERLHAAGGAIYGGTTEIYRNNIARTLGLPRSY